MLRNILSSKQRIFNSLNGGLQNWDNPGTHCHDYGDSSLTMYTPGPRTSRLSPNYEYLPTFLPRVWFGTNKIEYDTKYDGNEIGFTIFSQIKTAATVNIVIYETSSDSFHNQNDELGSWYMQWTNNFPYSGVQGSWSFSYPQDTDLKTFLESTDINYTFTSINIKQSPYEVDGYGMLTDNKWTVLRSGWHRLPETTLSRNIGIFVEVIHNEPVIAENAQSYFTYPAVVSRTGYRDSYIGFWMTYDSLPSVFTNNDSN